MLAPTPFTHAPKRGRLEPPVAEGRESRFDWTARLSMDMIRQHTKTQDVPGVTDEQLALYRDAAVEAAELYTGLLLTGQRTVVEPIQGPAKVRPGHNTYRFRLRYPVADGMVHIYGSPWPQDNVGFRVPPGSRTIKVPLRKDVIDLSNCCDPCAANHINGGMMAAYRAGFACPDDVPAGVVLGMLQFIAWTVEHPGDEYLSVRNAERSGGGAAQGTNNIAMASGALETWRVYDAEAL